MSLHELGFTVARMLLRLLWHSSILLLAVGLVSLGLRRWRPSFQRNLWLGALLLIPLLPLLSNVTSELGAPRAIVWTLPRYPDLTRAHPSASGRGGRLQGTGPLHTVAVPQARAERADQTGRFPWALVVIGYASMAGGLLASAFLGMIRLCRCRREGVVVTDPRVSDGFRRAAKSLGVQRDVDVLACADLGEPVTVGALRPAVLLPRAYAKELTSDEIHAVALHEMSHIRARDPLLLSLVSLVRAAVFFQPLVWLAARQMAVLTEQSCDEAVLRVTGENASYARLLLGLARKARQGAPIRGLAAALVLARSSLVLRTESILSFGLRSMSGPSRTAFAAAVGGAVLSLFMAVTFTVGDSRSPVLWSEMAFEASGLQLPGEAGRAFRLYQKALAEAPSETAKVTVLLQMAATHESVGSLADAFAVYEGILRGYPETQHAARICFRLGELHTSVSLLPEGATQADGDRLQQTEMLPERGIAYFEQAVASAPPLSPWVLASRLYLARLYMDTDRQAEAWAILRDLATLNPEAVNTPDYVGPYAEMSTQETLEERVAEARAFAAKVRQSAQARLVSWSVVPGDPVQSLQNLEALMSRYPGTDIEALAQKEATSLLAERG